MKPTSFENAIRLQFDTLMKKVIDGIIKNYEKELDRRSNREIPFCELPKIVVNSFPVFDDYELDVTILMCMEWKPEYRVMNYVKRYNSYQREKEIIS